jgi:predicted small secreted protein
MENSIEVNDNLSKQVGLITGKFINDETFSIHAFSKILRYVFQTGIFSICICFLC